MDFRSDNSAPACPEVMEALVAANRQSLPYDGDEWSGRLDAAFSDLFGTPVAALWISTGTAANALALATLCPPYGAILCQRDAHIDNDECGAPEFYTHGAKLVPLASIDGKLTPQIVDEALTRIAPGVHQVQAHALSITNVTESGQIYRPGEVATLGALARDKGLALHMDGARFANAVAALGCHPADISWKAGVDVLSFGFIKNGGMSAEALIFFRPDLAAQARYRRKRGGHLLSKGRYSAAQLLAMLRDDLWLRNASAANAGAQRLAAAARDRLCHPVEANMLFLRLNAAERAMLREQGVGFYDRDAESARFVLSWDQRAEDIERLAALFAALP